MGVRLLWWLVYALVAIAIVYPLYGCGSSKGEGWASNFMCLGWCTRQEAEVTEETHIHLKNGPEQSRGNDNAGQE